MELCPIPLVQPEGHAHRQTKPTPVRLTIVTPSQVRSTALISVVTDFKRRQQSKITPFFFLESSTTPSSNDTSKNHYEQLRTVGSAVMEIQRNGLASVPDLQLLQPQYRKDLHFKKLNETSSVASASSDKIVKTSAIKTKKDIRTNFALSEIKEYTLVSLGSFTSLLTFGSIYSGIYFKRSSFFVTPILAYVTYMIFLVKEEVQVINRTAKAGVNARGNREKSDMNL
eukprot:Tbor_TRINITY_DN3234_c0_g1::TRINITY_DN3234_c0_g1_i1::g.23801::m.23801